MWMTQDGYKSPQMTRDHVRMPIRAEAQSLIKRRYSSMDMNVDRRASRSDVWHRLRRFSVLAISVALVVPLSGCPICVTDAQCDDGDACTTDVCGADRMCSNTAIQCPMGGACVEGACVETCEEGADCGACCNGPTTCRLVSEAECDAFGGAFHGVQVTCGGDCNNNDMPDACEPDCNGNGLPDDCDIAAGTSSDCNGNGVADECEPDCNGNGIVDACDIDAGTSSDCDDNGVPDACDVADGANVDCDGNGVPDSCDLEGCPDGDVACADCNQNGIPDGCDIAALASQDCNIDGIPDECARCLIPGDLNGDLLVDNGDDAGFDECQSDPCAEQDCACADMDLDGDVDAADRLIFDAIRSGGATAATMAIADFEPRTAAAGERVTISGVGFLGTGDDQLDAEDLCIVAMNEGAGTAIPFQAVDVTDTQLFANVGALAVGDEAGTLMIAQGVGDFVDVPVQIEGVRLDPAWIWQFHGGPVAVLDLRNFPGLFIPKSPPCYSNANVGELVEGQLCLTLEKDCPAGTTLEIYARAWDHTPDPNFGVDGYIPNLEFTADKNVNQCGLAICDAIVSLYQSQTPPVTINCFVSPDPGGGVKVTLVYPDRPITWGRFSVSSPYVEIEINDTAATDDDYVVWSPTFCRARAVGLTSAAAPMDIVLTNDNAADIPDGGNVRFAAFQSPWPVATTATATTLPLSLPADGTWVPFVIAGEFGSPSTNDKDTLIEAHVDTASGVVCGKQCLMVRVRKNANTLTTGERDRYVNAILGLHSAGNYAVFQEIHSIASSQAHHSLTPANPAFLPWHRAFVLEYERALQGVDPSVAAHYWIYTATATNIFHDDFMGTNDSSGLVMSGPFAGWTIDGLTPIDRGPGNHQGSCTSCASDATVLAEALYADFRTLEGTSHDCAHGFVGGWMGSVPTATRDPIFFLLHSNVERLYCEWQSMGHHGNGVDQFDPQGSFSCGTSTFRLGAHLNDTLWPWNGLTGPGSCTTSTLDDRPSAAPGGAMDPPAAAGFNLGPPAVPTIDDVVDYLGRQDPSKGIGVGYDDVPYN